ncbi:MAG: hypothetical protein WC389_18345 [Lutibacter sp.]|jgi:transcription elongation factor Elf1
MFNLGNLFIMIGIGIAVSTVVKGLFQNKKEKKIKNLDEKKILKCDDCGSTNLVIVNELTNGYKIFECKNCGFLMTKTSKEWHNFEAMNKDSQQTETSIISQENEHKNNNENSDMSDIFKRI